MRWFLFALVFFMAATAADAGCPGGRCPQVSARVRTTASVNHQPHQRRQRVATVTTRTHSRVHRHR